ncbi:MAG: hypothetical protein GPI96_01830 [Microcystis aeruginosa BS13-02]|uniref:DUF998 domain-containing protein n=1 Tax=Microcystis aeruginosa Ma_MB_S_20031200_S102 TaxID=2486254 RepID=A0A552E7Z7_MICAE|nr:hypothetical protein [Microcystis aeruginosa BS13-02]TRU18332.1 MAG: hypothetical protein EWV79_22910 [Microcystis aeruginosa Ma_MB_S_20031200_S102D]TRU30574.1 MAG: hypothetical protein EWV92_21950 [Microcystis aeruginosa Ma_MB_S_20031200_S102]
MSDYLLIFVGTEMNLNKLREHILETYYLLRIGMALIGIFFPLVLWWVGLFRGVKLQGSISAYYHTSMGDVFVGSLCAIGVFLYFYKGVTTKENVALNFAGIFAVLVALLPTSAPSDLKCETFTAPYWHGASAILFFIAIAYVCWFRASDTISYVRNPSRQNLYSGLYRLLAIGMIFLPLLSAFLLHLFNETNSIVYFVELLGVWVFSAYWIIKTLEIRETNIDNKAFENQGY